ncbi:efflux RND transporter periplasmic adaptor subunit [Niveibacterium sp.]|uniref:efflux RND transporter periplasmic adaptor subunit n=1 Tax=Niveibacterium sp. TaxID=2017444 RepID=UPI0035B1980F
MHNKKLLIAAFALAAGVAGYAYFKPAPSGNAKGGDPTISVRFAAVERRTIPVVFETSGFVTPVSSVEVRAQISSTIREVLVKEGDTVAAGTPLFRLDGRAERAALDKLKAQHLRDEALLADARRTLTRNIELKSRGFVSQGVVDASSSNVDALEATVAADRAAIAEAQVAADYGVIAAPQAGRVGLINVRVGSLVQPGSAQALTTLTRLDPIDIAFSLPEAQLARLRAAQTKGPVHVLAKDDQGEQQGELNFIDSAVDSSTGGVRVKARFDNAKLRLWPGAQVTVGLTLDAYRDAPSAPLAAVQVGPDGQFVFAADADGRAKSLPVKILYQDAEYAVLDGVEPGTKVVTVGGQNLRPGTKLRDADKEQGKGGPKAGVQQ